MAEVVLFHSALGLRPGVLADADRLRAAGHRVHTPDLFDGDVLDDFSKGTATAAPPKTMPGSNAAPPR